MTEEEHKTYCLHKYVAQLDSKKRELFFQIYSKKHGENALEQLKCAARKVYLELKNANHVC